MLMPKSLVLSWAITSCKVSRSRPVTRTVSPWLAAGAAGRGLDFPVGERLERDAPAHELLLEDVVHVAELGLVLGGEDQLLLAFEPDLGAAPLEVEALPDLLHRLVERVLDLDHL